MIASTGRVEFLLSRAPLIAPPSGMQHTVMSLIFWYAGETHERTRIHARTYTHSCEAHDAVPLSGEDASKTNRSSARLASFTFSGGKQQCRFIFTRYRVSAPFHARSWIFSKRREARVRRKEEKKEIEE